MTGDIASDVNGQHGVEEAALFGQSTIIVYKDGADYTVEKNDVSFIGVEAGKFIEPEVVEGSALDATNTYGVLVDK